MPKRNGWTVTLSNPVTVETSAAIGGVKEEDGPLGGCFDIVLKDDRFGEESWEKAESKMQREVYLCALNKANLAANDIDYILAGDLLNQCISSSFGLRESGRAFFGLYGACSTMAESLMLGSFLVSGGFASHVAAVTSSHFATAERQFRNPLEYGGQRTPSAQWTATAAGCAILGNEPKVGAAQITKLTAGRIVDLGIKDANNMGAAMAPAAADTLQHFFEDTKTTPQDYDLIVTGDLGKVGYDILVDLMGRNGYNMGDHYTDCGLLIYDRERQDVHAGGSGCGCSASVLCGHLLPQMQKGIYNRMLFCATGALMSTTSSQQGESIPGICHLLEMVRGE